MSPAFKDRFSNRRSLVGGIALLLVFLSGLAAQQIPRFRIKEEASREFFRKGVYFYNQREYVTSREFFYKALDVQPSFHLARRFLGDAHYYSGEWNEAMEQWELLDTLSAGAYPLVRQRSELLRFGLQRSREAGDLSFFRAYTPQTWRGQRFERPVDVGLDAVGNLYVLSLASANILKVDPAGDLQDSFRGPLYDRLAGPVALVVADEKVFVADFKADRVRVFSTTGRSILSFGETGSQDGQLRGPEGIAIHGDSVFVSDGGNRRIVRFTKEGVFRQNFGLDDRGRAPGAPAGMAVDGETLFVVDTAAPAILCYDLEGNFVNRITSPGLKRPRGLAVSSRQLVVTDEVQGVLFYHLDEQRWRPMAKLRDNQDRELVLNRPFSARTDGNGVLYLADYGGHRVITVVPEGLRTGNMEVRVEKVDSRDFPNMAVFLTVRNRIGNSVRGLSRRRLRLFENDRRVGGLRTDNMKVFQNRANLVIVKESSPFLDREFPGMDVAALRRVVEPIRIADRISVIRVGEQVRTVYSGLHRMELLDAVQAGEKTDKPNLGKGLFEGIASLLSGMGPRAVLLFASGKEFPGAFDQYTADRLVQFAVANEIALYVVSCEGAPEPEERQRVMELYRDMATRTGGRYMRAFDETGLAELFRAIREARDERYVVTYRSQADRALSGHYVEVRVEARDLGTSGKGNGGYFVP